jgi:hypothetical protein
MEQRERERAETMAALDHIASMPAIAATKARLEAVLAERPLTREVAVIALLRTLAGVWALNYPEARDGFFPRYCAGALDDMIEAARER